MKKFKDFITEANGPTNSGNANGTQGAFSGSSSSPSAGFDPFLFPRDMDLLDQGYQTPAEPGLSKWTRYSNVYPVMKVSLGSNLGDGPSIDSMVSASKEFVDREAQNVVNKMKKTYLQFMGYKV